MGGVVGANVPPNVYSEAGDSEPGLHYYKADAGAAANGLWGVSETGGTFQGYKVGPSSGVEGMSYNRGKMVKTGEAVGILVNMDLRSMQIFRFGELVVEIR